MRQPRVVAAAAVRKAAQLCRRVQAELVAADSLRKPDRSPVTVADFASQALVCAELAEAFPDEPVLGEESAEALRADPVLKQRVVSRVAEALGGPVDAGRVLGWIDRGTAERPATGRFWTLDPIDGTKGFLRGQQYAVALARLSGGVVELGVLGCPNLETAGGRGLLLSAERGGGVERLPLDGDAPGVRVSRRAPAAPREARLVESVEPSHSSREAIARIAGRLGLSSPSLRLDSQVKYAAVALGLADVYLRLPASTAWREWIWDHAAGALLVEEAGGVVSDALGRPLDFSAGRTLPGARGILAAPRELHAAFAEAARAELDGAG